MEIVILSMSPSWTRSCWTPRWTTRNFSKPNNKIRGSSSWPRTTDRQRIHIWCYKTLDLRELICVPRSFSSVSIFPRFSQIKRLWFLRSGPHNLAIEWIKLNFKSNLKLLKKQWILVGIQLTTIVISVTEILTQYYWETSPSHLRSLFGFSIPKNWLE